MRDGAGSNDVGSRQGGDSLSAIQLLTIKLAPGAQARKSRCTAPAGPLAGWHLGATGASVAATVGLMTSTVVQPNPRQ
jgi:hypothetical protein